MCLYLKAQNSEPVLVPHGGSKAILVEQGEQLSGVIIPKKTDACKRDEKPFLWEETAISKEILQGKIENTSDLQ